MFLDVCLPAQPGLRLRCRVFGALLVLASFASPVDVWGAESGDNQAPMVSDDGRRTMNQFFPNLGRGFAGVFQRESLKPFLIGLAATGLSSLADDEVRDEIAKEDDGAADFAADYLGPRGLGVVTLGLLIGGRYSGNQQFRDMTYDLSVAFVVNLGYTGVLKAIADRERPNEEDDYSFPSGHTSNAFALASVAGAHYGKSVGVPAYGLATLIGISRLRGNVHWLSDVVAGATLGHLVGLAVVRQDGAPLSVELSARHTLQFTPNIQPSFKGVTVGMNF